MTVDSQNKRGSNMVEIMRTAARRTVELLKSALALVLVVGMLGAAVEVATVLPAATAKPVFYDSMHGFASYTTGATTVRNTVSTIVSMVTGGTANMDTASLTIVTQPPVTKGSATVSHTASHAYITFTPKASTTGKFSLKFGICGKTKATYSPTTPTCTSNTMTYAAGATHPMGGKTCAHIIITTVCTHTVQTIRLAATGTVTIPKTGINTYYVAPAPEVFPAKSGTGTTIHYGHTIVTIVQMPVTTKYSSSQGHCTRSAGHRRPWGARPPSPTARQQAPDAPPQ